MKQHFTAVLKGHIAVATARFPKGTRGIDLDPVRAPRALGRSAPTSTTAPDTASAAISRSTRDRSRSRVPAWRRCTPGMLISNEPGYYKVGAYGIRIENVVLVTLPEKAATASAR